MMLSIYNYWSDADGFAVAACRHGNRSAEEMVIIQQAGRYGKPTMVLMGWREDNKLTLSPDLISYGSRRTSPTESPSSSPLQLQLYRFYFLFFKTHTQSDSIFKPAHTAEEPFGLLTSNFQTSLRLLKHEDEDEGAE
ncbi:hypothetical protein ABVT39_011801 [Epinephelus coioides]